MVRAHGKADNLIRPAMEKDRDDVLEIFNFYAEQGFAAYPDSPVPPAFYSILAEEALAFLVLEENGEVIGFSVLRPFLPFKAFSRTGTVSTFISGPSRSHGYGSMIYKEIEKEAGRRGIVHLIVNISSLNPESLSFHKTRGFAECGRFHEVGSKWGQDFDMIWMEKRIHTCSEHNLPVEEKP